MSARWLLAVAAVLAAAGCATSMRRSAPTPAQAERIGRLQHVVVAEPRVEVYKLTAGSLQEEVEEWSRRARTNVVRSLGEQLGELVAFSVVADEAGQAVADGKEWGPLDESWALFDAVHRSIQRHLRSEVDRFPHKTSSLDYTLGAEFAAVAEAWRADAVVLVTGEDGVSTSGRKTLAVFELLLGLATGAAADSTGSARLVMAVVEGSSGDILWYNAVESRHDLRDRASCDLLVAELVEGFPSISP